MSVHFEDMNFPYALEDPKSFYCPVRILISVEYPDN